MRFLATKDDPLSSWIASKELVLAVLMVGGLIGYFLIGQLNLFLGFEREKKAVLERVDVHVGTRSNSYTLVFNTEDGDALQETVGKYTLKRLDVAPGSEVNLKTDGLFWRAVVAVDNGKGFERLP
jgi:hypothetical protein